MLRRFFYLFLFVFGMTSCVSTKLTIKNINEYAKQPEMLDETTYKLEIKASDKKYGFHPDYPVNIGFGLLNQREYNPQKFLNALQGPNGEKITYTHDGNCCPFPTDKSELGVGMLEVYLITWEGNANPFTIYLNIYEKGDVMIPIGFTAK